MVRIGEIEKNEQEKRERWQRFAWRAFRIGSPPALLLAGYLFLLSGISKSMGMILIVFAFVGLLLVTRFYERRQGPGWRGFLFRRLELWESLAALAVLLFVSVLYFFSYLRLPVNALEARLVSAVSSSGLIAPPGYLPVVFLTGLLHKVLFFLQANMMIIVFTSGLTLIGALLVYRLTENALHRYRKTLGERQDSFSFLPLLVALLFAGSQAQWGQATSISGIFSSFSSLLIILIFYLIFSLETSDSQAVGKPRLMLWAGLSLSLGVLAASDIRLGLIMAVSVGCFLAASLERRMISGPLLWVGSLGLAFGLSLVLLSAAKGGGGKFIDYCGASSFLVYWLAPLTGAWTSVMMDWGSLPQGVAYDLVEIGNELNLLISWAIVPGIILSRRLFPNYSFSLIAGLIFLLLFAKLGIGFEGFHLFFAGPLCPLLALGLAVVSRYLQGRLIAAGEQRLPRLGRGLLRAGTLRIVFSVVLLVIIITPLTGRYSELQARGGGLLLDFGRRLLTGLPRQAIVFFQEKADYQACIYLQGNEGIASDVDAIYAGWLANRWYLRQVIAKQGRVFFGDIDSLLVSDVIKNVLLANRDRPVFVCGWNILPQDKDFRLIPNLHDVAVLRRGEKFVPDKALVSAAVEIPAGDPAAPRLSGYYYRGWCELGGYYEESKELALATDCYEAALRVVPEGELARKRLASLYNDRGQLVAAREKYREIVEKSPEDIEAHLKLAEIYTRRNQLDKAMAEYERAIALNDKLSMAHYYLGEIYRRKEMGQRAMRQYQKAVETEPANVKAHLQLGMLYKKHESYQAATKCFQEVLRLDQDNAQAQEELWEIYNLQ